jgi:hypothetical protein
VIKSKRIGWARFIARMGEIRNAYVIVVGKPEGKSPLGRPRRRWQNNIRMDFGETGWEGAEWIQLAEDSDHWRALVNTVMKFLVS